MLGKLFKHEMKSYRFSMGIVFLTAFVFTILMKTMCMMPYHDDFREMVQVLSFMVFYYAIMAVAFATQILIVVRFYTTSVGDRGYLTWTLPVKTSSVLWSKILAGGIWYIIALFVIVACFVLFVIGDYWTDGMSGLGIMIEDLTYIFVEIGKEFHFIYLVPVILYILTCVVWSLFSFMMLYMCIAIGQLFGKWRILASIGAYFVIGFLLYIVTVIVMFAFIGGGVVILDLIDDWDPFVLVNLLLLGFFLLGAGSFAGVFAITNNIFKRHLNLE